MRFIDADVALQRFIEETEASGKNVIHINTIKRILQDIDTAYDVEKVVAELEEMKNDRDCQTYCYEFFKKKCENYEKAIDIVRKGGAT